MRIRVGLRRRVFAVMCLLAGMCAGVAARAQQPEEVDLSAKQRILPAVGPGLRAVRQGADGRLYILASPSPGLVVVDTKGKQLLSINEMPTAADSATASHSLIAFGEDCDVDAEGKIYVADRGANLIRVFAGADGAAVRPPGLRWTGRSIHGDRRAPDRRGDAERNRAAGTKDKRAVLPARADGIGSGPFERRGVDCAEEQPVALRRGREPARHLQDL